VAALPMPVGLAAGLSCLALIQLLAFVLNMLPVPGLDGFGVLEPWLPAGARALAARVRPWAPLVLFALLLGWPTAARWLLGFGGVLFAALGGDVRLADAGYGQLLFWR
jgi:Zn-dependent protease